MEIYVSTEEIQKALKMISAVAKPNSEDVSGQVLIDADTQGRVVFLGYNGKQSLTHLVPDCQVKKEGKISVSFAKLSSFVNSFSPWNGTTGVKGVQIKQLKHNVSVKITNVFGNGKESKNKLTLKMYPIQNFFVPPPFKEATFSIPSGALKLAISKVIYAINPNSPRSFIQGMNISFDEEHIYFAGTDALKLSEYKAKNE